MSTLPTRQNQWFQPGEGIAREVITADIQRYLGNDALVRPGEGTGDYEGVQGYWITAYRNLTSQMVQDLRLDSARWRVEIQQGRVAYQDSSTHRSRQYYGPSAPAPAPAPAPTTAEYAQPPQPQQRTTYPAQPTHPVYADQPAYTLQQAQTRYEPSQSYPPTYNQEQGQGGTAPTYTYTQQGQQQGQGQRDAYYPTTQPPRYYGQQQPAAAPQGSQVYSTPQQSTANAYYTGADGRTYSTNQPPQANDARRRRQN